MLVATSLTYGQTSGDKMVTLSGNVGIGLEYGLLPFVANAQPPQSNIFSDGYLNLKVKDVPFNFHYYYSSVSTISGLNNYAKVQFDANAYKRQLKEKVLAYKTKKIQELGDIQSYKQKLEKQLNYLEIIQSGKIKPEESLSLPALPDVGTLPFDLNGIMPQMNWNQDIQLPEVDVNDSISPPAIDGIDTLENIQSKIALRREQLKSALAILNKAEKAYAQIQNASIDSLYNSPDIQSKLPAQNKFKRILAHTDKLELGLCYPSHSVFTISRTPLRGINYEYSKNKRFFSFTHGKTLNNLFIGNNILQNNLNAARNLYNFFDFNNVQSGRRITSIKYGWGEKNGTHLYVGAMHGYGQTSYLDTISTSKEHNLVAELDAQIKLKKGHLLSAAYGRSYIQTDQVNSQDQLTAPNTFFDLTDRVNAAMISYDGKYFKEKTDLQVKVRYVDPFFKSLGLGFMRSDNFRYEARLKQRVKKNFKLAAFFRREQDNLLKLYDFNNYLTSFGLGAELKIKRSFFYKLDIRPVVHNLDAPNDSLALNNQNFIVNTVLNYRHRIKKKHYVDLTAVYAYYQLFNGEDNNIYQNINVSANLNLNNKWTLSAIFNQYISSDTAIIPIAGLIDLTTEYRASKFTVKGGGKMAIPDNSNDPIQLGYLVAGSMGIFKRAVLELSAERLVIGEFYNSLLAESVLEYPYNFKAILRINI